MAEIALISHGGPEDPLAYRGSRVLRVSDYLGDVARVAAILPPRRFLLNLCNDRYRFAVGLGAALVRNQISLLPPSQAPGLLEQLGGEYDGLYVLSDVPQETSAIEHVLFPAEDSARRAPGPVPKFPEQQLAAIAFTSGSTGRPTPHPKTWGSLARGAIGEAARFGLLQSPSATVVGTVPPQHMYGLESSVLMVLRNGLALHAARPFYPADLRAALEDLPGERVLVTTPVHLRALLSEDLDLPQLRLILCATAPLSAELAIQAEARYGAPLHEVYGFTEAGMVATRRPAQGLRWHNLPEVRLRQDGDTVRVQGGHIEIEVAFTDVVEMRDSETFELHGRGADLVNVAGKRTSLGYLNHQLSSIEGVQDGVFFMPQEAADGVTRLTAFVVAPGLARETLLSALRSRIDAVFLPRPLYFVDALPRNATGKLPREALMRLAADCSARSKQMATTIRKRLAKDHAAAAGHFPGNPIIPGAVLLDEIIEAATAQCLLPDAACVVKSAKFLKPVRPGDELLIRLQPQLRGEIRFECLVGEAVAVSGALRTGARPEDAV